MKLNKMFSLFRSKPIYQFYLYSGNQQMIDRDVTKMQQQGWEIAGEIKPITGNHGWEGMLIPLKRKTK